MDYRQYYDLESFLLSTVQPRFLEQGYLSAVDFFCIVIWKANRAKSKVARKLLAYGHANLDEAVRALTTGVAQQKTTRDKMRYLLEEWGFRLPMASAILTVFYPDEFTVYDKRVCDVLGRFHNLNYVANFDNLWLGYQEFKREVVAAAPEDLTLREKDRYLWGKSFHDQLQRDIEQGYSKEESERE